MVDDYIEQCRQPLIYLDHVKMAAAMDTLMLWNGLLIGYCGALLTILVIVLVLRCWRESTHDDRTT